MKVAEIVQISFRPALRRLRLGDKVERFAKPIAKALRLPCLDENDELLPESPCAKRRDRLNGEKDSAPSG